MHALRHGHTLNGEWRVKSEEWRVGQTNRYPSENRNPQQQQLGAEKRREEKRSEERL